MNQKEGIEKLVKLLTQQESIDEDIKSIKDELKESGHNPAILVAVAKAIVKNKVDDLLDKANGTIQAVDVARS